MFQIKYFGFSNVETWLGPWPQDLEPSRPSFEWERDSISSLFKQKSETLNKFYKLL